MATKRSLPFLNETVNFYDFALLFRDHLKLPNACIFDGAISRDCAPRSVDAMS